MNSLVSGYTEKASAHLLKSSLRKSEDKSTSPARRFFASRAIQLGVFFTELGSIFGNTFRLPIELGKNLAKLPIKACRLVFPKVHFFKKADDFLGSPKRVALTALKIPGMGLAALTTLTVGLASPKANFWLHKKVKLVDSPSPRLPKLPPLPSQQQPVDSSVKKSEEKPKTEDKPSEAKTKESVPPQQPEHKNKRKIDQKASETKQAENKKKEEALKEERKNEIAAKPSLFNRTLTSLPQFNITHFFNITPFCLEEPADSIANESTTEVKNSSDDVDAQPEETTTSTSSITAVEGEAYEEKGKPNNGPSMIQRITNYASSKMPNIALPKIGLPSINMPNVGLPNITNRLSSTLSFWGTKPAQPATEQNATDITISDETITSTVETPKVIEDEESSSMESESDEEKSLTDSSDSLVEEEKQQEQIDDNAAGNNMDEISNLESDDENDDSYQVEEPESLNEEIVTSEAEKSDGPDVDSDDDYYDIIPEDPPPGPLRYGKFLIVPSIYSAVVTILTLIF